MNEKEKIQQYLSLMNECRNLGKDLIADNLSDDQLLECIKDNAEKRYKDMCINKGILKELIFDRDPKTLSDENIKNLQDFASTCFAFSESKDNGISYAVHKLLLQVAKEKNDEPMIIEELYSCGISLTYLIVNNGPYKLDLVHKKMRAYFNEAVDNYFEKYQEYDSKTRFYLLRCLGNRKLSLHKNGQEGLKEYLRIYRESMKIFENKKIQEMNPEIPFDNIIYSMHMDALTLNNFIKENRFYGRKDDLEDEIADVITSSLDYVKEHSKNFARNDNRLQNWRIAYFDLAISYLCKGKPIDDFFDYFISFINEADLQDYFPSNFREVVVSASYTFEYTQFLDEKGHEKYDSSLKEVKEKVLNYIEGMNERNCPQLLNNVFAAFSLSQTVNGNYGGTNLLNYIIYSHKPTYVHSLMVATLSKEIMSFALEEKPEMFIGVLDCKSINDVKKKAKELEDFIFRCGLYHDIGKTMVLSYISTYERGLLDEEFECIKNHTTFGAELLDKCNEKDLAIAALYHHKTYDGKGGYPNDVSLAPANMKPLVDIISVADSLDAGTDFIGRSYNMAKSVSKIVSELKEGASTRYSPDVVSLFDKKENYDKISTILNETRKKVYVYVYRNNKYEEGK